MQDNTIIRTDWYQLADVLSVMVLVASARFTYFVKTIVPLC